MSSEPCFNGAHHFLMTGVNLGKVEGDYISIPSADSESVLARWDRPKNRRRGHRRRRTREPYQATVLPQPSPDTHSPPPRTDLPDESHVLRGASHFPSPTYSTGDFQALNSTSPVAALIPKTPPSPFERPRNPPPTISPSYAPLVLQRREDGSYDGTKHYPHCCPMLLQSLASSSQRTPSLGPLYNPPTLPAPVPTAGFPNRSAQADIGSFLAGWGAPCSCSILDDSFRTNTRSDDYGACTQWNCINRSHSGAAHGS